jgi:ribonuclease HI
VIGPCIVCKGEISSSPDIVNYLEADKAMEKHFNGFTVEHMLRAQNSEADKLAKGAARKQQLPPDVFYEEITTPSIRQKKEKQINAIFSEDWRSPIMAYL